jgi:protein-disulfide isomerase/uncharacterized membrane protein
MLKRLFFLILLFAFCIAGILLSYSLAEEYYFSDISPGPGETLGFFTKVSDRVCGDESSFMSCESVSESAYANLGGIPLAILGLFFYTLLTGLATLTTLTPKPLRPAVSVLFFWAALLGSLLNIALLLISLFVIGSLCPLCLATYVCCWACLGAAAVMLARYRANPLKPFHAVADLFFRGGIALFVKRSAWALGIFLISAGLAFGADRLIKSQRDDFKNKKQTQLIEKIVRQFQTEKTLALNPSRPLLVGDPDAPVTITEFSDFLCPYCAKAAAVIDELIEENPTKVKLLFVNYPLDRACNKFMKRDMHQGACSLALGAFCAAEQDGFEAYQRLVFQMKPKAPRMGTLLTIAEKAGLSPLLFERCITDPEILAMLQQQIGEAKSFGVSATPRIYINNRRYRYRVYKDALQKIIDLEYQRLKSGE